MSTYNYDPLHSDREFLIGIGRCLSRHFNPIGNVDAVFDRLVQIGVRMDTIVAKGQRGNIYLDDVHVMSWAMPEKTPWTDVRNIMPDRLSMTVSRPMSDEEVKEQERIRAWILVKGGLK